VGRQRPYWGSDSAQVPPGQSLSAAVYGENWWDRDAPGFSQLGR
jgi:hypothetical protein